MVNLRSTGADAFNGAYCEIEVEQGEESQSYYNADNKMHHMGRVATSLTSPHRKFQQQQQGRGPSPSGIASQPLPPTPTTMTPPTAVPRRPRKKSRAPPAPDVRRERSSRDQANELPPKMSTKKERLKKSTTFHRAPPPVPCASQPKKPPMPLPMVAGQL